ncbi:hypothetical protein OAT84_03345 [Gammaproteobacteria bacterium]|nr:hypothetical protein [Gammaproteobacteria bacterium]
MAKQSKGKSEESLSSREIQILSDLRPYAVIENKPKTKTLKSKSGPDIHSGDLGDPVILETDFGWGMRYYLPQSKKSAYVEVGMGMSEIAYSDIMLIEEQTFLTAAEVVDYALNQGWKGFSLKDGTPAMSWAIWAYLKYKKIKLGGYKPEKGAETKYKNSWHIFEKREATSADVSESSNRRTMVQGSGEMASSEDQDK